MRRRRPAPATPLLDCGVGGLRISVAGGHFARNGHAEGFAAVEITALLITMAEGGNLRLPELRTRPDDFDPMARDRLLAGALRSRRG